MNDVEKIKKIDEYNPRISFDQIEFLDEEDKQKFLDKRVAKHKGIIALFYSLDDETRSNVGSDMMIINSTFSLDLDECNKRYGLRSPIFVLDEFDFT